MSPLAWLVVGIALLVVEMLTPGLFFFACFGIGAMVAALAAMLGAPIWLSWVVFFVVSLSLILLVAPLARRWMKQMKTVPVGLDSFGGQKAIVLEDLDPNTGKGQVRLSNGAIWIAACEQPIAKGTQVEVICVTGTRLRVRPCTDTIHSQE